jgi:short-subunit dehydrogenase
MSRPQGEREVAIVTGASSGIGEAFAKQLAKKGFTVLAVARRRDRLERLADEARATDGGPIVPLPLDVTEEGAARRLRDHAASLGPIAWLVNNAGTVRFGRIAQADPAAETAQVRLMCEAVVSTTTTILPLLVERRKGIILNLASVAGFQPTPLWAVYGAAKAFVLSYSEALSYELSGTGVRVTALCPGPVTTELFDVGAPGTARTPPRHEISAEACARFGIAAAEKGKVVAIPGARNRLLAISSQLSPRPLVRWASGRVGLSSIGYGKDKDGGKET